MALVEAFCEGTERLRVIKSGKRVKKTLLRVCWGAFARFLGGSVTIFLSLLFPKKLKLFILNYIYKDKKFKTSPIGYLRKAASTARVYSLKSTPSRSHLACPMTHNKAVSLCFVLRGL